MAGIFIRTQGDIKTRHDEIIELLSNGNIVANNKVELRHKTIPVQAKALEVMEIIKEMQLTYFELGYFLELVELLTLDRWIR